MDLYGNNNVSYKYTSIFVGNLKFIINKKNIFYHKHRQVDVLDKNDTGSLKRK